MKLVVNIEPTFDVNMAETTFAISYIGRSVIVHTTDHKINISGNNDKVIPNFYFTLRPNNMIYSTQHDGKWYHLYTYLDEEWDEIDNQLFNLMESGLEPYQAFEVLAL